MTLDEAIKHAEEVMQEKLYEYQECTAVHDAEEAKICGKCAEEHRQLAEWLIELKHLREAGDGSRRDMSFKVQSDQEAGERRADV